MRRAKSKSPTPARRRWADQPPPLPAKLGPRGRRWPEISAHHLGHHLMGRRAAAGFRSLYTQTSGTARCPGSSGPRGSADRRWKWRPPEDRRRHRRRQVGLNRQALRRRKPGESDRGSPAGNFLRPSVSRLHRVTRWRPEKAIASVPRFPRHRQRNGGFIAGSPRPGCCARTRGAIPMAYLDQPGRFPVQGDPFLRLEGAGASGLSAWRTSARGGDDHGTPLPKTLLSTQARVPSASRTLVQPSRAPRSRPAQNGG